MSDFRLTYHLGGLYYLNSDKDLKAYNDLLQEALDIAASSGIEDVSIHPPFIGEDISLRDLSREYFKEIIKEWLLKYKNEGIGLSLETHVSAEYFIFNGLEDYAEHSWHVCLSALMLKDYADEKINIDKVIKMLLIHDLGEIDSWDTIIYESEKTELKENEADGVRRLLGILPEGKTEEYMELWYEFEAGKTADSKFAKAIDRIPPLFHNLYGEGHSWKENKISKEKVFSLNSRISEGSQKLWQAIEAKLNEAVSNGILK